MRVCVALPLLGSGRCGRSCSQRGGMMLSLGVYRRCLLTCMHAWLMYIDLMSMHEYPAHERCS